MNEAWIGKEVVRYRNSRPVGAVHHVESVIADRLVMHCGRQMHLVNKRGRLDAFMPTRMIVAHCSMCNG